MTSIGVRKDLSAAIVALHFHLPDWCILSLIPAYLSCIFQLGQFHYWVLSAPGIPQLSMVFNTCRTVSLVHWFTPILDHLRVSYSVANLPSVIAGLPLSQTRPRWPEKEQHKRCPAEVRKYNPGAGDNLMIVLKHNKMITIIDRYFIVSQPQKFFSR